MQYLLLISHDDSFIPTERLIEDIRSWHEDMRSRGLLRDGRPLRPPADAVTVRVRDDAKRVTAGPPSGASEHTAAYDLLECDSLEQAIEAAAAHPMAAAGTVEVRPVWEELVGPTAEVQPGSGGE